MCKVATSRNDKKSKVKSSKRSYFENMQLSDEKFREIFPFPQPRANQREIIEKILTAYENGKRYVILNAPTGIGKSAIGYSVSRYYGSSNILTSQKVLQEQYYKDFKIPYVLGRANYSCTKNTSLSCELGMCFRVPTKFCRNAKKEVACPYLVAKEKCLSSPYTNLNYSYFLSLFGKDEENAGYAGRRRVLVCDECHSLDSELLNQCTVRIDTDTLKFANLSSFKLPSLSLNDKEKIRWLIVDVFEAIRANQLYLKNQLNALTKLKSTAEYKKFAMKFNIVKQLATSIFLMKEMHEHGEHIVISQTPTSIEYKMLHCNQLFDAYLGDKADFFLFMSATVLNYKSFAKTLGLNLDEVEYIECPSLFPVENRLIHYQPVGSMSKSKKDETFPKLLKMIDRILRENPDVKGIIHTVSYDVAVRIMDGLAFSDQAYRLLMPPKGKQRQLTLDAFYTSDKPYVLVSPSLMEGIDLKDDLSRLCIICKVPYANLGDKWTKTRMEEDPEWYLTLACMNIIQMSGRSIRSDTDYAKTYILDSDFEKLAMHSIDIIPKWWQESVVVGS